MVALSGFATAKRDRFLPTSGASLAARVLVAGITVAGFGPYLVGSIRTEQLFIYLVAAALLPFTFARFNPRGGLKFFIPWLLYIIVACLGVLFPTGVIAKWAAGNLLAGFDNIAAPLAVMLVVWSAVPARDGRQLLTLVAKIVAIAMAANGLIAIVATRIDIAPLLRPFWSTSSSVGTTAELAAQLGRYSGIFNQPAEAGTLYGIAGLLAVYVWKSRPRLLIILISLIVIGGLITVSKIFILGGLPLILIYWLAAVKGDRKVLLVFSGLVATVAVVQSGILGEWTGFNYLARLINPDVDGGALAFYTAGRLSEGSGIDQVITEALRINALSGVGAAGWAIAYDSLITEAVVVGGVIGLVLQICVLLAFFFLARKAIPTDLRIFAFLFAILVVGASLGFNPLTANRVSTITWLIVSLLVLSSRSTDEERDRAISPMARITS